MKAISIMQPHASLVAIGAKRIETRSWSTKYRGSLAIHASKKPFNTDSYLNRELYPFADALGLPDIFSFDTLTYGCIIATCNLVDCIKVELIVGALCGKNELIFGDYTPGRYAWILEDVQQLPEPIPAKGKLGLWDWDLPEGVIS